MTILPHPNIIQKLRELLINSLCIPEKWSKHLCGCPWVCVESLKRHCNMHTHFIFCTSVRLFVSCHFKLKHMTAIIFILMSSLLNLSHQLVFNRRNLTARFFHAPTVQKSQLFSKSGRCNSSTWPQVKSKDYNSPRQTSCTEVLIPMPTFFFFSKCVILHKLSLAELVFTYYFFSEC